MPQFVILEHDHPAYHWDFMIEQGDALATWRLLVPEEAETAQRLLSNTQPIDLVAEILPDHRREYLDYEGVISGGRGSVRRLEAGLCHILLQSERLWELRLEGESISGFATLKQLESRQEWRFLFLAEEIFPLTD